MRTDRSRTSEEDPPEPTLANSPGQQPGADAAPVSRRSLLAAAGGVLAGAGLAGIGAASAKPDGRHQITATPPYLATVRDALADEQGPATELAVQRVASDAASPPADGGASVHVSGHPVLDRDAEFGPAPADAVAVAGRAALVHADGEWRDCLPRSAVREQWTSETPVETWSELPGASAGGSSDAGDSRPTADPPETAPADDATQLVRGTRSAQYARGCGGESYYTVESDALDAALDEIEDEETSSTPVARLAYVHVDESVRDDASVAALFDRLGAGGPAGDDRSYTGIPFVDPAVDAA